MKFSAMGRKDRMGHSDGGNRVFDHARDPAFSVSVNEVDHPSHYGGDSTYETIKVIEAWDLNFNLGNTVKYISRAGKKKGSTTLTDLEKARWYLDRQIEIIRRELAAYEREMDELAVQDQRTA